MAIPQNVSFKISLGEQPTGKYMRELTIKNTLDLKEKPTESVTLSIFLPSGQNNGSKPDEHLGKPTP